MSSTYNWMGVTVTVIVFAIAIMLFAAIGSFVIKPMLLHAVGERWYFIIIFLFCAVWIFATHIANVLVGQKTSMGVAAKESFIRTAIGSAMFWVMTIIIVIMVYITYVK